MDEIYKKILDKIVSDRYKNLKSNNIKSNNVNTFGSPISFDFASLYPSVQKVYNIRPINLERMRKIKKILSH